MKICSAFLCLMFAIQLSAQTLPIARNYQEAYNKQTRSTDGKPGKNYWQNTASYNIDVRFDPATRIVSGNDERQRMHKRLSTLNKSLPHPSQTCGKTT